MTTTYVPLIETPILRDLRQIARDLGVVEALRAALAELHHGRPEYASVQIRAALAVLAPSAEQDGA